MDLWRVEYGCPALMPRFGHFGYHPNRSHLPREGYELYGLALPYCFFDPNHIHLPLSYTAHTHIGLAATFDFF